MLIGFQIGSIGADFIPILDRWAEISYYPRLEIAKLAHFEWYWFLSANTHKARLTCAANRSNIDKGI